jgi:thioesterase domain-containing protein
MKLWDGLAQRAGLGPEGAAEVRRLVEVCKAHLIAAARYRPAPYAGPIVLFRPGRGRSDKRWQTLCSRMVVERVPGDHYSLLSPPHVDDLANRLTRLFDGDN